MKIYKLSFKEHDTLTVYHGFRSFNEAYSVALFGLSGRDNISRVYSYESNNNPFGLFVSTSLKETETFTSSTGPVAVIIEFKTLYSDLEAPVWPGGSYTVQGGFASYWDWNNLSDEREQRRLLNREESSKSPDKNIYESDRPELAKSLLGSEHQALFIGDLNPESIRYFWYREPSGDGYFRIDSPFHRISRDEFIDKFKPKFRKDEYYRSKKYRSAFSPEDVWDKDKFVNYILHTYPSVEDEDQLKSLLNVGNINLLQYVWPKQESGLLEWLKQN